MLSASLTTQLADLERTVNALRELPDHSVRIVIGGHALDDAPDLWRRIGADAYSESIGEIPAIAAKQLEADQDSIRE